MSTPARPAEDGAGTPAAPAVLRLPATRGPRARRRPRRGAPDAAPATAANVVALERHRIARALAARSRYRYVKPRVLPADPADGAGWQVRSPNCSRNIDPAGGEIAIAWLQPQAGGRWRLHAFDHAAGRWQARAEGLRLAEALTLLNTDPERVYWP